MSDKEVEIDKYYESEGDQDSINSYLGELNLLCFNIKQ